MVWNTRQAEVATASQWNSTSFLHWQSCLWEMASDSSTTRKIGFKLARNVNSNRGFLRLSHWLRLRHHDVDGENREADSDDWIVPCPHLHYCRDSHRTLTSDFYNFPCWSSCFILSYERSLLVHSKSLPKRLQIHLTWDQKSCWHKLMFKY